MVWQMEERLVTPFQEFRLWLRRAPGPERAAAGVAAVLALAVLVWELVPTTQPSSTGGYPTSLGVTSSSGNSASSAGATAGGAGGGTAPPSGAGAVPPGSAGAVGSTRGSTGGLARGPALGATAPNQQAASRCSSPSGGGKGVTSTEIKIAIILVDINVAGSSSANGVFHVASTSQQKAYYNAVLDDVNSSGGVACRKLAAQFFSANPADSSNLQQTCLDIVQAGSFAVLDPGAYAQSTLMSCYAQNQIAYFGGYLLPDSLRKRFYPYLFEFNTFDRIYHDTVFGLKSRGFFDPANGFRKLGFLYESCFPDVVAKELDWLRQVGISGSQLVTYDDGCPSTFPSPSDDQQAVLKFQQAGVTHITDLGLIGNIGNFTNIAQRQGYHPKYGLPDDELVPGTYGSTHPDYQQLNGAIAITNNRDGENTTPGARPTAGTARCDAILAKHGLAPTYKQPDAAGNACDHVWMFVAAVSHAPALRPDALAAGLQSAGSVEWGYPQAPTSFTGAGVTTGGQFYRTLQFTTACNCWRVIDPTFRPSKY